MARVNQTCHLMPAGGWTLTEQEIEPLPPVIEGTVFLSTTVLYGVFKQEGVYEAIAKKYIEALPKSP